MRRVLLIIAAFALFAPAAPALALGDVHQGEVFYLCYHDSTRSGYENWRPCKAPEDDSTYMTPVLIRNGQAIEPLRQHIYIRNGTRVRPVPWPDTILARAGNPNATAPQKGWAKRFFWQCDDTRAGTHYATPPDCPNAGSTEGEDALTLIVKFGQCLGTFNSDAVTKLRYPKKGVCPDGTTVVPRLEVHVQYTIADGSSGPPLSFATGSIYGAHAWFRNGWERATLDKYIDQCIETGISCHVRSDGTIS
jgi:hypothetical protein